MYNIQQVVSCKHPDFKFQYTKLIEFKLFILDFFLIDLYIKRDKLVHFHS